MSDINWDVEVKKLEREFSGLPAEPSAVQRQAKVNAERRAQQQRDAVTARVGATVRLAVVGSLFGGLFIWPYQRECGFGLFGYMAVEVLIVVASLYVATYTWTHRVARAHVAAFVILLGALALITTAVVPRLGYAQAGDVPKTWTCRSR